MIPGVQPKLELTLETEEPIYTLIRKRDGLVKESARIMWVEWNKDGTFKDKHNTIAVRRSLVMSPFNKFYTWMTTIVTEILEETDSYVRFKTKNSEYELKNKKYE